MATTTLDRSSFSRRSATYTASTFTAFEYGSSYEYHGMYNIQTEHDKKEEKRSEEEFDDDPDLDQLLSQLTPEELTELSRTDPDDSSVPPNLRCMYHCDKIPTSPAVNRPSLIRYLRETSLNDPIREEIVPFIAGQKRGKIFIQQTEHDSPSAQSDVKDDSNTYFSSEDSELSQLLENAKLADLREIADILGVMYQDDCQAEQLTSFPVEPDNDVDFHDIIEKVEANDPTLTTLNLNNVKNLQPSQWTRLFLALKDVNTQLKALKAANCNLEDVQANLIAEALADNKTLQNLTLDSNLFSFKSIVKILRSVSKSQTLQEIRLSNQQLCKRLGHQNEVEIVQIIEDCPQLLRLGISLEFRHPLNKLATILQRNLSNHKLRSGKSDHKSLIV